MNSQSLLSLLANRGCDLPQIDLLQPADPFLDTAGEDLRRRIFITADGNGAICPRPNFTHSVACIIRRPGRRSTALFWRCLRQQDEPHEFRQAGMEDLGDTSIAAADARSVADALATLDALSPKARWHITLGDQAVFEAVIRALGLPAGWRKKLVRSFGSPEKVEALIASLSAPRERGNGHPAEIAGALDAGDTAALASAIARRMEKFGYLAAASRTPVEIATRMVEQAALDNARLSAEHIADLREFLSIRVPLAKQVKRQGLCPAP
ncbi:MAG: ATP phosphoribosyltransferase regulatory subunit [Nitratireductor sp.]